MNEEKTEGIVLRSLEYKDSQRIVSVFTPYAGMISVLIKGISSRNLPLLSLCNPFSRVEFLIKRKNSELLTFVDGSLLDSNLPLRQAFSSLAIAGQMAQSILTSQLAGKSSADTYFLFRSYLKQIPTFQAPEILLASFQLKFLTAEGLLALSATCNLCDRQAEILSQGESLCRLHSTGADASFTAEEWSILLTLHHAKHFSQLRTLSCHPSLLHKIDIYFKKRL